jgi:broad specificity polyphosphatase/5'/3'-nucleotidase SurE
MSQPQILLTNDDGILSPGLWAAAEALSALGYVNVVAPREQWSGAGRSLPNTSDGIITPQIVTVNNQDWTVYSVGGTPAHQCCMPCMKSCPAAAGGFGHQWKNIGLGVTISGTVGNPGRRRPGHPALAISLEPTHSHHLSYSTDRDSPPRRTYPLSPPLRLNGSCRTARIKWTCPAIQRWRRPGWSRASRAWAISSLCAPSAAPGTSRRRWAAAAPHIDSDQPSTDVYVHAPCARSRHPLSLDLTSRRLDEIRNSLIVAKNPPSPL